MANANNKTTLSISEILGRKLPAMVTPGKYENVEIKSTEHYPVTDTNKQEFLRITYKTEDGREIAENRFPQGLNILISHLREQLKLQEQEVDVSELLTPGKHKFTIWVKRENTINAQGQMIRVTNINFLEPLASVVSESATPNAESPTTEASPEVSPSDAPSESATEVSPAIGDPLPDDAF